MNELNNQKPISQQSVPTGAGVGTSRRRFIGTAASGAFAMQFLTHPVFGQDAPSNKLRLAGIGIGGMGAGNMRQCEKEEIVALCDVDSNYAAGVFKRYPDARRYRDYRELFAKEEDLDGVVIATPDHTHAVITMEALRQGAHVFCQKPLTHTVVEARTVTEFARKSGLQTQMGNQGHSSEGIRLLKEWVADGAIGNITEVHAWTDRPVGGNPWSDFPIQERPKDTPPVPDGFDWDLWLGPVAERPYHPIYHPKTWRGWVDFGTGSLGDMGCHILDPAFYALELGSPVMVEGTSSHFEPALMREAFPRASMVRFRFAARKGMPPVTLHWYDGRLKPLRPAILKSDPKLPSSGAMLVGDEGVIVHGSHGAGSLRILPDEKMAAYKRRLPEKTIPRVKGGHEGDWLRACKDGRPASSSFDYGGPLTELVLLGMAALRRPNQQLEWDTTALQFSNNDEANQLLHSSYREGWSL